MDPTLSLPINSSTKNPSHIDKRAWKTAQDFESVYLSTMIGQMMSNLSGDGPLAAEGTGGDAWRGMLTEEMAKTISLSGGVGITQSIYSELIRLQSTTGQPQ
jgi:Rod binding domain-containing protein